MRRLALAGAWLLCICGGAQAADAPTAPEPPAQDWPLKTFDVIDEHILGNALGILGTTDSADFRSLRLDAGALVQYRTAYDFSAVTAGATRYEQEEWSAERYALGGAIRRIDRATGAGIVASGGLAEVEGRVRAVFEATWNRRLSAATGVELIGQRDFVETASGLATGTMSNFGAASVDYAATERLTLIGLAGLQYFSDDNLRTHLRGRAILGLLPEHGLSLQVRARTYHGNHPGGSTYFNPGRYEQADIGLRLRRSLGDWRLLAAAGAGREQIDRTIEKPTSFAEVRLERSFSNNLSIMLSYVVDHDSASDNAMGDSYTWQYLRAVLVMPF